MGSAAATQGICQALLLLACQMCAWCNLLLLLPVSLCCQPLQLHCKYQKGFFGDLHVSVNKIGYL